MFVWLHLWVHIPMSTTSLSLSSYSALLLLLHHSSPWYLCFLMSGMSGLISISFGGFHCTGFSFSVYRSWSMWSSDVDSFFFCMCWYHWIFAIASVAQQFLFPHLACLWPCVSHYHLITYVYKSECRHISMFLLFHLWLFFIGLWSWPVSSWLALYLYVSVILIPLLHSEALCLLVCMLLCLILHICYCVFGPKSSCFYLFAFLWRDSTLKSWEHWTPARKHVSISDIVALVLHSLCCCVHMFRFFLFIAAVVEIGPCLIA